MQTKLIVTAGHVSRHYISRSAIITLREAMVDDRSPPLITGPGKVMAEEPSR